jgi:hypothetical protein
MPGKTYGMEVCCGEENDEDMADFCLDGNVGSWRRFACISTIRALLRNLSEGLSEQ